MGSRIGLLVIGIIGLVAAVQFALTGADLLTILILGIGLSVAAIPESLPAIVTLTLALGSKKLLNKQALVRRLPVVEALGSVNYIVTDKTGTLTEGVMTVKNVYFDGTEYEVTGTGTTPEGEFKKDSEQVDSEQIRPLLECGFYCNNAEKTPDGYIGDPTETALLVAAKKAGIEQDIERRKTIPFSSDRKRMTVVSEQGTAYMKGAPGVVLDRCTTAIIDGEKVELDDELRQEIIDKNTEYATDALRVLGFARSDVSKEADKDDIESEMTFLGLQGMIDPARDEVDDAIQDCRTAGIGVVMATGDNIETAKAIGKELGFKAKNALTGPEIEDMSVEELRDIVKDTEIFARVSPRHKVKVLEALQDQGFNVAMTGDGVNDAPALKDSDVGVAMGQRGTDVAKKSSDMVLQDDNFATIRDAISEGRGIYDNIRKVTNQLLSTNSGEVMFVFLGTLIGGFFFPSFFSGDAVVLTALMILWVNFASDGPPAIALSEDPNVDGIMERDPREPDEPILDKKILAMTAVTGPLAALTILPVFFLNIESFQSAQTMLFMGLAFFEMMMFFVIRRDYGLRLADNKYLVAAMGLSTIAHLSLLYTPLSDLFRTVPLGLPQWGQVAAVLALFGVCEFGFRRLLSKRLGTRKP
jgi:Ca2+-transporting ATPase